MLLIYLYIYLTQKTLYASHGRVCFQYTHDELQQISDTSPTHFQADHEEADTPIAFHLTKITATTILVRASGTYVLVIVIGILGKQRPGVQSIAFVIMGCGNENNRRYKNVTNITDVLEERKAGLARALPGYHAFTVWTLHQHSIARMFRLI